MKPNRWTMELASNGYWPYTHRGSTFHEEWSPLDWTLQPVSTLIYHARFENPSSLLAQWCPVAGVSCTDATYGYRTSECSWKPTYYRHVQPHRSKADGMFL